jgi:hypothetical protein
VITEGARILEEEERDRDFELGYRAAGAILWNFKTPALFQRWVSVNRSIYDGNWDFFTGFAIRAGWESGILSQREAIESCLRKTLIFHKQAGS